MDSAHGGVDTSRPNEPDCDTFTTGRRRSRRLRQVLGPSNAVYFETVFSSVRAWSIWAYAYVAIAAVVIVTPSRASDS